MNRAKQGEKFYPTIDTERGFLGRATEFTARITKLADGSEIENKGTGTFSEMIHTANDHTATMAKAAKIGMSKLEVSASTFVVGDTFKDASDNMYTILSLDGDLIGITPRLKANIAKDATLSPVGNTGAYSVECQVDDLEDILIDIHHPELGNVPVTWKIVEKTLEDGLKAQDDQFDILRHNATMKIVS